MPEHFYRSFARLLWRVMLTAVVLLACYVSLAQVALDALPRHREAMTKMLGSQLNLNLHIDQLEGRVRGFTPELRLTGLELAAAQTSGLQSASLLVNEATISIDPWASLMALQLRPDTLLLRGVELNVAAVDPETAQTESQLAMLAAVLRRFARVSIVDSSIAIERNEERFVFGLDLNLRRYRSQRDIELMLSADAGAQITLSGRSMGDPSVWDQFNGQFYGTLVSDDLGKITRVFGQDAQGQANLQFWVNVNQGSVATTLDMSLSAIELPLAGVVAQPLQLDRAKGLATVEIGQHQTRAFLNDVSLALAGSELHLPRVNVLYERPSLAVAVASVDAEPLLRLLLAQKVLPNKAANILAALDPKGMAQQIVARVDNVAIPSDGWSVQAQVIDATTLPYKRVPGLSGIDAMIDANDTGALAWINTEDFTLDLPRFYDQSLAFNRVEGVLKGRWTRNVLWLEEGVLEAQAPEHSATVLLGMDIPLNAQARAEVPLALYLDVGATGADIAIRNNYLPKTLPPQLDAWLARAVRQGYAEQTAFSWRGRFDNFGGGSQSMQLGVRLRNGTIAFDEAWPAAKAPHTDVILDTHRLSVWSDAAQFDGVVLSELSVEGDIRRDAAAISAAADFEGSAQALLGALRRTPIYNRAASVIDDLTAEQGSADGRIQMSLDALAPSRNPHVSVGAELTDVTLSSALLGTQFTDVHGNIGFDLKHGFSSDDLQVRFLEEPLKLRLAPGASGREDADIVDARFDVRLPASKVEPWLVQLAGFSDTPWQSLLTGESQYSGSIAVGQSSQVTIHTDLLGTSIDLPAPIGKTTAQVTPLQVELNLAENEPWALFWSERASAQIYRNNGGTTGALIDLTPRAVPATLEQNRATDQVRLTGVLPTLDIDPWLSVWRGLEMRMGGGKPSVSQASATGSISIAKFEVSDVRFGDVSVGAVQIDMTPYQGWDMIGVNTQWLDAEFTVHRDNTPSSLIINSLDLDRLPDSDHQDKVRTLRPPTLSAPIDVILANVYYGGQPLGAARFHLNSEARALHISALRGQLAGLYFLPGSALAWSRGADGQYQTHATIDVSLNDISQLFKDLGREPAIASRSGTLKGGLSWPGSPLDIDSTRLLGDLSMELAEGSFLPVSSGATGFMRVLSVLNLAGLFQRANVARLFDPGVTFNRADGQFVFEPGRVLIPRFDVDARGGGFKFDSDIDLLAQTIDGELIVTLPLAENIPWVAALAGGLPVAAGAYLVSKVFEDQVRSFSSGVYTVTGDLSQPKVKFERVFDATPTKDRQSDEADVK